MKRSLKKQIEDIKYYEMKEKSKKFLTNCIETIEDLYENFEKY